MHFLLLLLAALLVVTSTNAQNEHRSLSERMNFACEHRPSLSFCKSRQASHVTSPTAESLRHSEKETRLLDDPGASVIPDDVRRHLEVIAEAVARARRNPFDGSDLHEKETKDEGEGEEVEEQEDEVIEKAKADDDTERGVSPSFSHRHAHAGLKESRTSEEEETHFTNDGFLLYKGAKSEYCEKYRDNYAYFCIGDQNGSNQDVIKSFCPSYRSACGGPSGSAPADPFSKKISVVSATAEVDEVTRRQQVETQRLELLKKRFPCKPDCDQRIHPHCTADCKCDYIYPSVQKFCNPPPIPMFLNTCRLWYYGCPKYERYHYASQYVYSKAEKGKVLPGPVRNPNPFGLPQPASPLPVAGAAPAVVRAARTAREDKEGFILQSEVARQHDLPTPLSQEQRFIVPPEIPRTVSVRAIPSTPVSLKSSPSSPSSSSSVDPRPPPLASVLPILGMFGVGRPKRRRTKPAPEAASSSSSLTPLPSSAPSPFSSLPSSSSSSSHNQQLVIPPEPFSTKEGTAPKRALQSRTFPVLPSDAAYGAGTAGNDPFTAFDGLTDSKGIAHRPRSRSPFTKPGLWEANPDDPHNRDHANKWWYHPESVGVDWLNGQATWGAHWAVPAAGVGGTNGFSAIHFPSIGTFLGIPDDYD